MTGMFRKSIGRREAALGTGAALIGMMPNGAGAVQTTVQNKLGESVSVKDFGAKGDGIADETAAIQAACASANIVRIPAGNYRITSTLIIPANVTLQGDGIAKTNIIVSANVVGIRIVGNYARLKDFTIKNSVSNTNNGIEIGDTINDGGRSSLTSLYVTGMGNDGIQVRNGNLGTIRDVASVSNGRDGINFTIETPNNNSWTLEGYNDLRGNNRDGLNFSSGSSQSDANASKCHFVLSVTCQQNGRYGVYSGTRSNIIFAYVEVNTTKDVYLDNYAFGNLVSLVNQASITDNGSGNQINTNSLAATYQRGFFSKVLFSGGAGKGFRIDNDDGAAGYLDFVKTAANAWDIVGGGSSGSQTLHIWNSAEPTAYITTKFGGHVQPDTDNAFNLGSASFRWSTVYAATGTINTSDENQKQDIADLTAAELATAKQLKGIIKTFRFKESVVKKGDKARTHFGVIAQDVKAAFTANGLDANKYSVFCSDTWFTLNGEFVEPDAAGIYPDGAVEVTQLGVRYEELLAFIIAAL